MTSNTLNPVFASATTIDEITAKLEEATVKLMGINGPANQIVLVRDMVIPELTIAMQAALDSVTPSIGANGNWYIGGTDTGVSASGSVTSPDGSVWKLTSISNSGTNPVYTKIFSPI